MTGLLLDTHVVMWWIVASPRVRAHWVEAVTDPANSVAVSAASVWEIELKKRSGKLVFDHDLVEIARDYQFELLPIEAADARRAGSLDWEHRDPFDRMLVAQALERGLRLVTDDETVTSAPGIRTF